ncbi:MAG TPA: hypothetical protein VFP10_12610 [Candidatus Eisenbacteria bacterium]|nr:hypothetical protein [Candidatus Eisenbacteria bacterium]
MKPVVVGTTESAPGASTRDARQSALERAVCAGVIVFCLSFALGLVYPLPTLLYYPLEHRWSFELRPDALSMSWYGRTLFSSVLSVFSGAIIFPVLRRLPAVSEGTRHGWTAILVASMLIAVLVTVVTNISLHPVPEPLPPGYVPK